MKILLRSSGCALAALGLSVPVQIVLFGTVFTDNQCFAATVLVLVGGFIAGPATVFHDVTR